MVNSTRGSGPMALRCVGRVAILKVRNHWSKDHSDTIGTGMAVANGQLLDLGTRVSGCPRRLKFPQIHQLYRMA